jgi:hypothetical protein
MKIAVLISGLPRYLDNVAAWNKQKLFQTQNGFEVDYYVHFWDDGSADLEQRVVSAYNPKAVLIEDYSSYIDDFKNEIVELNKTYNNSFYLVPQYIRDNILFDTYEPTDYGKNFWGQFLSTYKVSKLVDYSKYDFVIKTRSDAVISPMTPQLWHSSLANVRRNPGFKERIFTPWMHTISGIPYFCDFAFISQSHVWQRYSDNLKQCCIDLATKDKALFYEFNLHRFYGISHWIWNKLSIYNGGEFLSYSVTWPMNFSVSLLREDVDITKMTYQEVNDHFLQYNN